MSKRLEGKTVVVLGASQRGGSGWTAAELLAAEGATVWVGARRKDKLQELADEIGGFAFQCDASDEAQVEAFVMAAAATTGKIDIVVAAVGQGAAASIDQTGQAQLLESFGVNFFGPFNLVRYAARHMTDGGSATLYSSITSTDVLPGSVAYSCAKAALNTFVKYAAIEYADLGIRVNALKLGILEGPQAQRWRKAGMFDIFMKEVPLGEPVHPAEIARTILFLATEGRSITGESIYLDGGSHLRRQPFPDEMSSKGLESMARRREQAPGINEA